MDPKNFKEVKRIAISIEALDTILERNNKPAIHLELLVLLEQMEADYN